ncbi:MAG: type III pantothenate kinase, partial [Anaerolineales bacterium]
MLLTIDIGNTNITLGLYVGPELGPRWRVRTVLERTADEYGLQLLGFFDHAGVDVGRIDAIAMASVVPPLTGTFVQACQRYLDCEPLVVDAGVKTGVRVL